MILRLLWILPRPFRKAIFKTILSDRVATPNLDQDLSPLYRSVREVLPLNQDAAANEILKRLTNSIVHSVAELRNNYGAASHGNDGYFESPIEMPEAEMVARVVDGMAGFLFLKHKAHGALNRLPVFTMANILSLMTFLDNQWKGYDLPLSDAHRISQRWLRKTGQPVKW